MNRLASISPDLISKRPEWKKPSLEDAAREFETMLIAQWLKSARDAGKVFATDSDMAGAESYQELAEKSLADTMSRRGTFGLARMMLRELTPPPDSAQKT